VIFHSEEALKIHPRYGPAHVTLAAGLLRKGRLYEAVVHLKESLKFVPDDIYAQANLAWVLATAPDASLRDGAKAIELAKKLIERLGDEKDANATNALQILAAGYAEAGRFSEATETAQQALQLAIAQSNMALREDLQSNIANYRRHLPWRDPQGVNKVQ
jgi:tetratricopeptide (TPR) repeat protein